MHRGKAKKRMLDIVAGQDRDRPIRRDRSRSSNAAAIARTAANAAA